MTRRIHLKTAPLLSVAVGLLAVLVLAACGGTSTASSSSNSPSAAASGGAVTILNFAFTPAKLTVAPGTTVTWTNKDPVAHDVTSTNGPGVNAKVTSLFASGSFNQGGTFSFTFTKAGTYYYECTIHKAIPAMHAVIVVK